MGWGISDEHFHIVEGVGIVANVAIAIAVARLASRANKLNREAHFTQKVIQELFDVVIASRKVKACYCELFREFASVEAKRAARQRWVREREAIEAKLFDLASMFPELDLIQAAWRALAEIEDTHAQGDALTIAGPVAQAATAKFAKAHSDFVVRVGTTVRTLRVGSGPTKKTFWSRLFD